MGGHRLKWTVHTVRNGSIGSSPGVKAWNLAFSIFWKRCASMINGRWRRKAAGRFDHCNRFRHNDLGCFTVHARFSHRRRAIP